MLRRLAGRGRFPRFIDLFEQDGAVVLVMEDLGGKTLSEVIAQRAKSGQLPSGRQVVEWGLQAADLLAAIHAQGLVYTDLKSSNFLVQADNRLALIDFELAHPIGRVGPPQGMGTPGYLSAQRLSGHSPVPADDLYGLGALLYFIATGAEPSVAPDHTALGGRQARLLNPNIPTALLQLIECCLASDPGQRPKGAQAVRGMLAAVDVEGRSAASAQPRRPQEAHGRRIALQSGNLLIGLVTDQIAAAEPQRPIRLGGRLYSSLDVNSGLAGGVISLAEHYSATGEERFLRALVGATNVLREVGEESLPLPGFFVGQAGLITALLWAGQVTEDGSVIEDACGRARRLASRIDESPDLFSGCAGQLRLQLHVARFREGPGPREAAQAHGDQLLAAVRSNPRGIPVWEIPAEHGGLSGQAPLGYAHGSAGIADALLDLYAVTGDPRIAEWVTQVAHGLARAARPTLADGSGRDWPPDEGRSLLGPFWCHGAAGVGRFLFNAWQLGLASGVEAAWRGAARSVELAARWAGPTQCHGIAGSVELLLDLYAQTGETGYRDAALSLAPVLEAWLSSADTATGTGASGWRRSPGFMIGVGGIASCLLRLSGFERARHPLYPRWSLASGVGLR